MDCFTENCFDEQKALTPLTLSISSNVTKWTIPIYQRLFVWQEEQIQQLLQDLYDACKSSVTNDYYIGIFTVVRTALSGNRVEQQMEWTVVDGQQRLTFLSLFAAWCIRQNVCSDEWSKYLYSSDSNFRIDYFGREEDKEDLKYIADSSQSLSSLKNRNFQSFCACMEQMQNAIKNAPDDYPRSFEEFADYVFKHTAFLVSLLPDDYDAMDLNRFFEKMNAAGRQLTSIDQIRGRYFPAEAGLFDSCLDFERRFADNAAAPNSQTSEKQMNLIDFLNADVKASDKNEKQAERDINAVSILSPETMLLHVLTLVAINADTNVNVLQDTRHIIRTFKEVFDKIDKNCFLSQLKEYRQWMDEHVIYLDTKDGDSVEYKLRNSDGTNEEANDNDDASKIKKLIQFQSMLYVSNDSWQGWILDYYEASKDRVRLNVLEELDLLKKRERERRKTQLPPLEQMRYGQIDRHWFWLLDYLLWEIVVDNRLGELDIGPKSMDTKCLNAIKKYRFKRNRSIEHLHPQNPPQESDDWKIDREQHKDLVRDGFGNLAMISASFNSSQGNDSIGVKFARLNDVQIPRQRLESIKMLIMFLLAGQQEEGWTVETANSHGLKMRTVIDNFLNN